MKQLGQGAAAGSLLATAGAKAAEATPQVKHRKLGQTGLEVSELGFGGHSWSYPRIPDGSDYRVPTVDECVEILAAALDMGVNFVDACTPVEEHATPGAAMKRLKNRDRFIISGRCCHKMKGVEKDKEEVYQWVDERLKLFQIDHFDLLMLSNTENDTKLSGLWDMSYSIEALEKVKQQGKVRFVGFGSHFSPKGFVYAINKFGKHFDVCSMPYNVRHRAAEKIMPLAKKAGLGMVTIKPFARGSLLKDRDLAGADAGLPRDMLRFVLENQDLDVSICGAHTLAQFKENFSASWMPMTPEVQSRLDALAAATPCRDHRWLEEGWLNA